MDCLESEWVGLKIRRASALGGSTPPPGTIGGSKCYGFLWASPNATPTSAYCFTHSGFKRNLLVARCPYAMANILDKVLGLVLSGMSPRFLAVVGNGRQRV